MRRVARSRATAGGASRGEDARATAEDQRSLARAGARPQRSPFVAALLSLRRNPLAMAGMAVFAFWLLAALLAPVVAPYDPNEQHFDAYRLTGPSAKYYFGTDDLGRDIFSRVLYGARVSVPAGFGTILATAAIGITLGALAVGGGIVLMAGLSFIGLGAVPPNPEWGAMINAARSKFQYWWLGAFPALAITSAVLSLNFLGDGLRDALDPRLRK